jgi:hypothetical protein
MDREAWYVFLEAHTRLSCSACTDRWIGRLRRRLSEWSDHANAHTNSFSYRNTLAYTKPKSNTDSGGPQQLCLWRG